MKLKLEDPPLFTKSIELISDLVLEVRVKITNFGLSIVAIDPGNISMVSLKIPDVREIPCLLFQLQLNLM